MRTHPAPAQAFPRELLAPLPGAARVLGKWGPPFQALVVFAFFTFARLSSLVPVCASSFDHTRWPTLGDLSTVGNGATLRLAYSKTQQQADGGFLVPMRASSFPPCPVALAQGLLRRATRLQLPLSAPLRGLGGGGLGFPCLYFAGSGARTPQNLPEGAGSAARGSLLSFLQKRRVFFRIRTGGSGVGSSTAWRVAQLGHQGVLPSNSL